MPRLRLNSAGEVGGYLDGVWWPRSTDLIAELPNLLAALSVRIGPVWRVVYDHTSWTSAPRQLVVGDRAIQLDAYPFELGNTLYLFGSAHDMIVLRVIAPVADRRTAHDAPLDASVRS
ncbi:hypothetical protein GFY24_25330 [Nocardia sp. SYP-A9097]|uniref:DUF5994 family protein n=1 Tax=Nocardia sp. SYP-A9097 TaxID=2663237 RepID=UPI00129A88EB|nr:DUF5994 family protein [Nocardia sp. SYP-A9097]MRH90720.1 hypothetical protein [Nocardia sp. SYP-A9097]